jgi:hypothetical protein
VPGTPPSVTCSVHADPDQYLRSWRPEGSISQPGAIPVKVTVPGDPSPPSEVWWADPAPVKEFVELEPLGGRRRPRRDGSARIAKNAAKTTRKSQEP